MAGESHFENAVEYNAVFVSWINFHGRSEGLARELGIREFSRSGGNGPVWKRYARLWKETSAYIREQRPGAVIVMQPPVVALLCVLWSSRKLGTRVAGDLHTGTFDDPKWTWATKLTLRLLGGRNLSIVTNSELATLAESSGSKTIVMHDLIEEYPPVELSNMPAVLQGLSPKEYVLVPVTYAYDEPLEALKDAASRLPDITWVFTGNAPTSFSTNAPTNIVFSGFVSREVYSKLLSNCGVVIAATTSENTMQRAGYEALCAARPVVTTNTKVLADYFADSALRADATGPSFAAATAKTLAEFKKYEERMAALRDEKLSQQEVALTQVRKWLGKPAQDVRNDAIHNDA